MRDKLMKLMEREGFILILFLCVCVVAGGTLFLSMRNINQAKKNLGNDNFVILDTEEDSSLNFNEMNLENLSDIELSLADYNDFEEVLDEEDEEVVEVVLPDADDEYDEVGLQDLEFEEDEGDKDWEAVESTSVQTMAMPVSGEIITEYTSNSLVYSETLEAWVGHGGIDIKANDGEAVKAAGDGVIKEVYEDALWGIVIVIDHGNELLTRYSNLSTKDMVKEGLQVKKGDHISKIGNTAKIEMLMEPHLHFEVIKNGEIVDPRSIIN